MMRLTKSSDLRRRQVGPRLGEGDADKQAREDVVPAWTLPDDGDSKGICKVFRRLQQPSRFGRVRDCGNGEVAVQSVAAW
jgi:hypothetical protein